MSDSEAEAARGLEEDVARIVDQGREVREKVATRVAEAMTRIGRGFESAAGVAAAATRGAVSGVRGKPEANETMRDFVDGVSDGVSRAALAARLAFDEAVGRGKSFAKEDVDRFRREIGDAGRNVTDAVGRVIGSAGDEIAGQADALKAHASRAFAAIAPTVRSALDAARQDPKGFAEGAAQASVKGAREAAGSLFAAIGGFLQRAGDRLKGGPT